MNVIGVAGWKNSGKTGLVERLVAELSRQGLTVSTIKHAHHGFDVDQAGTDSFRHRAAGSREVLVSSRRRWALMHENQNREQELAALLAKLEPVDLVIVEGFKGAHIPKIETRRLGSGGEAMAPNDSNIVAVASDIPADGRNPPEFDLGDEKAIAAFIRRHFEIGEAGDGCDTGRAGDAAAQMKSAMPPGVDWMPVDAALSILRENVSAAVETETVPFAESSGRVLASDVEARRSSPPAANSAVDGYGFRFKDASSGECVMPLAPGRSAAGDPHAGIVPPGHAVRILTGAALPIGVDTVVLSELTDAASGSIKFNRPRHPGANTRLAGEDLRCGARLFSAGRQVRSRDIASLAAAGLENVVVFRRLRVAVISTGNEITDAVSSVAGPGIIDANRPMLASILTQWGFTPVDLGIARDEEGAVRRALDAAAESADAILISGGASSGDEDHVSRLLTEKRDVLAWRIAVKPGRPLALARWNGIPVFGLPGNPVAAFVCTLVFARPALSVLAGGEWLEPTGFRIPAGFQKDKKPGRREFIRARLSRNGFAESFRSEGSGLTSGLAWADGLVELEDGAREIRSGSLVRYIPYSSFGL